MLDRITKSLDGSSELSRIHIIAIVIISFALVIILFGVNLFAQWWAIDDHEIMGYIGEHDRTQIRMVMPLFKETEVGNYGNTARFRPSYYFIRIAESVIWGKNPMLWYGFRLWIVVFFVSGLWLLLARRIGFVMAGLLAVYAMTFAYWSDIFSRLGPAEAYGVLGIILFSLGFEAAYQDIASLPGWLAMFAGLIIASGSKENFVLLILPMIFLLVRAIWQRKPYLLPGVITALGLAWCLWIVAAVLIYIRKTGRDVYAQPTNPAARLQVISQAVARQDLMVFYLLGVIFLGLWLVFRNRRPEISRISAISFGWIVFFVGLYLSQVLFYNGNWPRTGGYSAPGRYDFPGMLYLPLTFCLIIWYVQHLNRYLNISRTWSAIVFTVFLVGCIVLVVRQRNGLKVIVNSSISNWQRTLTFTSNLSRLVELSQKYPDYALVFQTDFVWDYEPVFSYPKFLTAYSVNNPRFFCWIDTLSSNASDLEKQLASDLDKTSKKGSVPFYEPRHDLKSFGQRCIAVIISGEPACSCDIRFDLRWK
jgi:hypothetical protein